MQSVQASADMVTQESDSACKSNVNVLVCLKSEY